EGAVTTAKFSGGVEVRSVAAAGPSTTGDLDQLKTALIAGSKMVVPGEVRMGRAGSIPNGPAVRWEMQDSANRSILYYVPGKTRYVMISLTAHGSDFDHKADKLELSMSTLHLE